MSVQKLLTEADKLLEKGKQPEAIAKIKEAFQLEPMNQLVATKLANTLIAKREPLEAAKVYSGLAKRLSDAGKNQVAIAIFKQALDLAPEDISLRTRFAQECESVGKLGDAYLQAQIALNYYLRRKKYFDASNLMPLMARCQPKDEKIKIAWIEILQLCQAEQKLVHLLVALCGPPGVTSSEFQVGGDPVTLSPAIYDALKKLVPFFPRDPKIAYTLAWCAYRRGKKKEFYGFLRECFRREPDFCLGMMLFARELSEDKKLNEAMFMYRLYKERMTADKTVDMLTLNRLMESFVEKNGWVKFIEDSGDLLDAPGFLKALTGIEKKEEAKEKKTEEEQKASDAQDAKNKTQGGLELPPAEIEIGGASGDGMELITATGQSIAEVSRQKKPAATQLTDPMKLQAELIKATIEATVAGMGGQTHSQTLVQPVILPAIQASAAQAAAAQTAAPAPAPASAPAAPAAAAETKGPEQSTPVANETREEPQEDLEGFKGESVEFTALVKASKDELQELRDEQLKKLAELEEKKVDAAPPPDAPIPEEKPVLPPENMPEAGEDSKSDLEGFKGESVEFTALVKVKAGDLAELRDEQLKSVNEIETKPPEPTAPPAVPAENVQEDPMATQVGMLAPGPEKTSVAVGEEGIAPETAAAEEAPSEEEEYTGPSEKPAAAKKLFNPLDQAMLGGDEGPSLKLENAADERTMMFSPIDVLDAAKVMQNRELADVKTKAIVVEEKLEGEQAKPGERAAVEEARESDKTKWRKLRVEGDITKEFSPVEAVQAAADSRRPMENMIPPPKPEGEGKPAEAPLDVSPDFTSGEATMIVARPKPSDLAAPEVPEAGDATVLTHTAKIPVDPLAPVAESSREIISETKSVPPPASAIAAKEAGPASAPSSDGHAFMPIPESPAVSSKAGAGEEEKVDLGDDLLEGPTRIFTQPTAADKTEHLIKEIKHDLKNKVSAQLNIDMLMKKADRYTAKRNYYLARKALRHAQALGADDELVKGKLREIRKLELPEGLYNTISSDQVEKVDTGEVLERLELEFDLAQQDPGASGEIGGLVETRIEEILRDHDPRTILDFGVGLHEMGLFRQAEALFIRLVEEFPDHAFDAYYLAAISKLSRRDFAGAASILSRLSSDQGKTDLEKIQIYYALGETFEKMRQTDRSKKFFRKVAELDANYRNIRHKLDE